MGAVDSSSSDQSVPEVKLDMPNAAQATDHQILGQDGQSLNESNMKRAQSNVGNGLRITFKVWMCSNAQPRCGHGCWTAHLF